MGLEVLDGNGEQTWGDTGSVPSATCSSSISSCVFDVVITIGDTFLETGRLDSPSPGVDVRLTVSTLEFRFSRRLIVTVIKNIHVIRRSLGSIVIGVALKIPTFYLQFASFH